jgi:hypothetical protein
MAAADQVPIGSGFPARSTAREVLAGRGKRGRRPALWDGSAAERIVVTGELVLPHA